MLAPRGMCARRLASMALAGALLLPPLITSIDNTLMYVCLPAAAKALHASPAETVLIANTYSVLLAGFLITGGAVADRFGRRRVLVLGVALFGGASLGAGLATTTWAMILARAAMGISAGVLGPATLALLRDAYPQETSRARMVAAWSSTFAVGAAVGPLLGGWFVGLGQWRWSFCINVPVCVVFLAVYRFLPDGRHPGAPRIDVGAATLLPASVLCLSSGVLAFASVPWVGAVLLIIGAVVGSWFVRGQLRASQPTVDLRLLANGRFRSAVVANFFDIFVLGGLVIVLSEYVQWAWQGSALELVLSAVPAVVVCIGIGLGVGWLPAPVREQWWIIPLGMVLSAIGCGLLAVLLPSGGWGGLVWAFCLVGAGLGITETLTNADVVSGGADDQVGSSSAISETAYELGSAFGVLCLGMVAQAGYSSWIHGAGLPAGTTAAARSFLTAQHVAARMPAHATAILGAARHALLAGTCLAAAVGAAVLLCAAIAVALRRMRHQAPKLAGIEPSGSQVDKSA